MGEPVSLHEAPVRRGCCGDCKFFARLATQCRKNPPTAIAVQAVPGQLAFAQAFPPVKESDWCGEFRTATPS